MSIEVTQPQDSTPAKESVSTGLTDGGVLSVGAGGTYSITAGKGQIADNSVHPPSVVELSWSAFTDVTVTGLPASPARILSFISIDSNGAIVQRDNRPTNNQRRDEIFLGAVVHVDNLNVIAVNVEPVLAYQPVQQLRDLAFAIGFFNVSGNLFGTSGTDLTFDKSAGEIYYTGSNYDADIKDPDVKAMPGITDVLFQYRYTDGTNNNNDPNGETVIDPNSWEDLATPGVKQTVSPNKWTIQPIFQFISEAIKLQYGQVEYNSLAAAKTALKEEVITIEPSMQANGLLRGWLLVKKGCIDLSDPGEALFVEAERFGSISGAGGTSVSNMQNAYDNSTNPEIVVDSVRGALTIQDNPIPIGANLLEVQSNGGGTTYFNVDASGVDVDGAITVTGLVDGRDVAADGTAQDSHIANTSNPHSVTLAQVGAWGTTGNSGTVDGTNFIGTTDAKEFAIRTNNAERMIVDSAGHVGINQSTPTAALHIEQISGTDDLIKVHDSMGDIFVVRAGTSTIDYNFDLMFENTVDVSTKLIRFADVDGSAVYTADLTAVGTITHTFAGGNSLTAAANLVVNSKAAGGFTSIKLENTGGVSNSNTEIQNPIGVAGTATGVTFTTSHNHISFDLDSDGTPHSVVLGELPSLATKFFAPDTTFELGLTTARWNNGYFDGTVYAASVGSNGLTNVDFVRNDVIFMTLDSSPDAVSFSKDILPISDSTIDIGRTAERFAEAWVDTGYIGTIYGSDTASANLILEGTSHATDGKVQIQDSHFEMLTADKNILMLENISTLTGGNKIIFNDDTSSSQIIQGSNLGGEFTALDVFFFKSDYKYTFDMTGAGNSHFEVRLSSAANTAFFEVNAGNVFASLLKIDGLGNLRIGGTNAGPAAATNGGKGVMVFNNANTAPTAKTTAACTLYAKDIGGGTASELHARDESNTETQITSHANDMIVESPLDRMNYTFHDNNSHIGWRRQIDMAKMARWVQRLVDETYPEEDITERTFYYEESMGTPVDWDAQELLYKADHDAMVANWQNDPNNWDSETNTFAPTPDPYVLRPAPAPIASKV